MSGCGLINVLIRVPTDSVINRKIVEKNLNQE